MNDMSLSQERRAIDAVRITSFAENLADSLDRQMKNAYKPEGSKTLRLFSAREMCDLTGISPSNRRTIAPRRERCGCTVGMRFSAFIVIALRLAFASQLCDQ